MAEMKNICGKIPMDLHEKVREEIELTESSTQKFLQQVIEEHFNRLEGKGEISMGAVRTVAVQVSEELFQRLKVVIGKNHMKQKDFLIQIIEEALEKAEAEWQSKDQPEESEQTTGELGTEETQPEESTEPERESEPPAAPAPRAGSPSWSRAATAWSGAAWCRSASHTPAAHFRRPPVGPPRAGRHCPPPARPRRCGR